MAVWGRRSSSGIELPAVNGGTASSITYNALLDRAIEVGAKDMVEAGRHGPTGSRDRAVSDSRGLTVQRFGLSLVPRWCRSPAHS
jgi:hypothetical protein